MSKFRFVSMYAWLLVPRAARYTAFEVVIDERVSGNSDMCGWALLVLQMSDLQVPRPSQIFIASELVSSQAFSTVIW